MIRQLIHTVFSKSGVALLNFALLMLSARWLGPSYRGELSLLIAGAYIMNLLAGMAGGPAVMNQSKDMGYVAIFKSLLPWQLMVIGVSALVYHFCGFAAAWHTGLLAILLIWGQNTQYMLIGRNQIQIYNYGQLLQAVVPLMTLLIGFIFRLEGESLYNLLLFGYYLGYGLPILIALAYLPSYIEFEKVPTFRKWIALGSVSQWSNLIQFMNYRFIFYMAGLIGHANQLGEIAVAMALAESVWIVGRSVSLVSTGDWIVNKSSHTNPGQMAIQTFLVSAAGSIILAIIPQEYIQWMIGKKYLQTHEILLWLTPGIALFSFQFPYAAWFASQGNYRPANRAAMLGFLAMLLGYAIIPAAPFLFILLPTLLGYLVSTATFVLTYHHGNKSVS